VTSERAVPTAEEIAAIKERAGKATAGPWARSHFVDQQRYAHMGDVWKTEREYEEQRIVRAGGPQGPKVCVLPDDNLAQFDADFIAHARSDVPALLAALDAAQAERDLLATDYDQALQRAKRSEEKFTTAHQFIDARDRMIDAAQARIAAVESDRQRDAYEAGERLYAAERRAEVAEARIVELEAERVHVLKQSNALSVASKGLRTWVVKFQGQIRADIAEDVAQMTADIGEAERLVEQAETELGRANVAEDPGEAVFSHEIPPIAPGRRPAPQLNPNWPYEDRSVKVCRGCGRQTLTFHAEGCEVASYEVVLDADCAPVATPEETE
jgi:hypothetical protein